MRGSYTLFQASNGDAGTSSGVQAFAFQSKNTVKHYGQFCCTGLNMQPGPAPHAAHSLYNARGERKYLSRTERARALEAAARLPADRTLFCLTLAWTGARLSEVLALRPIDFQLADCAISFRTLKRRRLHVRQVPVPPPFMQPLERHFRLRDRQADPDLREARLWPFHRVTAWRVVKCVMMRAEVHGSAACPKAFRHGFGTGTIQAGVPITLLQRWLGHARLSTTAIYTDVAGPEEHELAERFWHWSQAGPSDRISSAPLYANPFPGLESERIGKAGVKGQG
jgi:integrase/recombinase XerD